MNSTQPNPFSLNGRRVLVTGGTQGVGGAIARSIARAGGDLCLIGLVDDDFAKETLNDCREFGVEAELLTCDLSLPATEWLKDLLDRVANRIPGINALVNNAGTYREPSFMGVTPETYEATMNLNVAAGFFLTQAFAKRWTKSGMLGRVVFTGSINGILSEPDHTVYDTSKGAVAAMVRSLCVSLAPHGIRVNSMAPGLVRTPLTNPAIDDGRAEEWMKMHTPNGQVPTADVCGGTVVFLLSDAAEHIQGQTIYVDGGMSIWQQPDPPE